jgi:hypothetical protein
MSITISDAVGSLRPNTNFSTNNGKIVAWDISEDQSGETQPTQAEIDAEVIRLQAEYDSQEYARNRASAYDSIGNQLDMIYKDNLNGTTTHKASVEAVKAKFPKPE